MDSLQEFLFVLPAVALIFMFVIYPFLCSLYYSFTNWDGISKADFIGLQNYRDLFQDGVFLQALKNTLFFTFVTVLFMIPAALMLAVILNTDIKGRSVLRTMFYIPSVISMVVVSNLWSLILAYDGLLNKVLEVFGFTEYIDWLGDYDRAPWVIVVILIWQGSGYLAIFFIAGLQSISVDIYEAAKMDGAGPFNKFFHITLPLLMPTFTVVLFLQLTSSLKLFDIPLIMTNGGPGNATKTLAMEIYNQAFSSIAGYATTTGIVLLILAGAFSWLQLKLTGSREVEM